MKLILLLTFAVPAYCGPIVIGMLPGLIAESTIIVPNSGGQDVGERVSNSGGATIAFTVTGGTGSNQIHLMLDLIGTPWLGPYGDELMDDGATAIINGQQIMTPTSSQWQGTTSLSGLPYPINFVYGVQQTVQVSASTFAQYEFNHFSPLPQQMIGLNIHSSVSIDGISGPEGAVITIADATSPSIPEPGTFLLALAGLAFIGYVLTTRTREFRAPY